jgi:hypothetical protein
MGEPQLQTLPMPVETGRGSDMSLYVFGIGGTGSRVLKSLAMLLAAGVDCAVDRIVPIIIDPDDAAADLTRAVGTIRKYNAVRGKLDFTSSNKNRFFKTEILETVQNFRLPLQRTRDVRFREYIAIDEMDDSNKALAKMLFSEENLESNMQVGFKGNPNIGSVVLNQFDESQEFREFATNFAEGDAIFIISSIFGGTGASGFPLLLKTLRVGKKGIPHWKIIQEASIGAISVLPYFRVQSNDSSAIDSSTFISKTKAALSYYERTISDTNSVNALYYIADKTNAHPYENHDGGATQKNNAHFIELVSALAILDFAQNHATAAFGTPAVHKEYGLENGGNQVIFRDLGPVTRRLLRTPLTQFLLFTKYLKEACYNQYKHQPWAMDRNIGGDFFKQDFYTNLQGIQADFLVWLGEMAGNDRRFSPFDLGNKEVFATVHGEEPRKLRFNNYDLFNDRLNKQKTAKVQKTSNAASLEQPFMELFYLATKELVEDKFNF